MREEAARIEADARARAEQAIQDRLGVTVQEGQSTEDAVRQGLESQARDGLLRLLGGGTPPAPAPSE